MSDKQYFIGPCNWCDVKHTNVYPCNEKTDYLDYVGYVYNCLLCIVFAYIHFNQHIYLFNLYNSVKCVHYFYSQCNS